MEIELNPLKQKHIERFFSGLRERGINTTEELKKISLPEYRGNYVRVCIDAGIIDAFDVDEADPKEIISIHDKLREHIEAALSETPKN